MKYKLTKRAGRNVEVSYLIDGEWTPWKSTGLKTKEEAHLKIRANRMQTFGDYAEGFYDRTDADSYLFRKAIRNKGVTEGSLEAKRIVLNSYLLPQFRDINIADISATMIDQWLMHLKKVRGKGKPCGGRCNGILSVLREILQFALADGLVESNEAMKVEGMADIAKERAPISREQLKKLFPDDDNELLSIWGKDYAKYFLIFIDTGFRPCEILALRYEDINDGTVYTEYMFDSHTKKIEHRIKTSKKGKKYKVGTLSERTLRLIGKGNGYIFDTTEIDRIKAYKMFIRKSASIIGRTDVTQYQLRHTFMTELKAIYPKELIMELMGHTKWEKCYDDSTPEQIIDNLRTALSRYQA